MGCKCVLIVEDDNEIRESLKLVLDLEGYTTFTAANGKEALEALARIPRPCIILLDLMMPVMNGWEFMNAKREDDVLATIPVLIVSAVANNASTAATGAAAVIKKPIELDMMLKVVQDYCRPELKDQPDRSAAV